MQGQLGERDLPPVFGTGLYTPALYCTAQAAVEVGHGAVEIGDHHDIQRGGVGLLEFNTQVVQVFSVTLFVGTPLDVCLEGGRYGINAVPLQVVADADGFLEAEIPRQVERLLGEEVCSPVGTACTTALGQLDQLLGNTRDLAAHGVTQEHPVILHTREPGITAPDRA